MRQLLNTQRKAVAQILALTFLLLLSFKTESLWTDEAFSAFVACHATFSSLWNTLLAGDSSDLQMWLYYGYLHFWISLFGWTEIAIRSANIPFILIYSVVIVWVRNGLFNSNWVWVAAFSPFVWAFAADARPYMVVVSLSTVFVTCLLAVVTDPRYARSRLLAFTCLSALLVGLNMHMLMILVVPPGLILVLVYRRASGSPVSSKPWLRPALILSPLFLASFVFLGWTFKRGTGYDYGNPDLLSMGSVLFRFLGLAGYAPNRHYDIPFTHYLFGMTVASIGFLGAAVLAVWPAWRARQSRTISLLAALAVAISETLFLSFVCKQQIEVRHLSCLFAFLLFLLFSGWEFQQARDLSGRARTIFALIVLAVAAIWLISDFRMTFQPDFRRENFRDAVAGVLRIAKNRNIRIAVVADPAAVAYYGLTVTGAAPCFPLPGSCPEALAPLPWPRLGTAAAAMFWTPDHITAWLKQPIPPGGNRVLLISRSRNPMLLKSYWWIALGKTNVPPPVPFHGFFVYNFSANKY